MVRVPKQYRALVEGAASRYGVPAHLLALAIAGESGWNPNTRTKERVGLAQINMVANQHITPQEAMDPRFAINWMARRMGVVYEHTRGNPLATLIFNTCPTCAEHYASTGKFGPTEAMSQRVERYLDKVLAPLGGIQGVERMNELQPSFMPEQQVAGADFEDEEEEYDPADEFLAAATDLIHGGETYASDQG